MKGFFFSEVLLSGRKKKIHLHTVQDHFYLSLITHRYFYPAAAKKD